MTGFLLPSDIAFWRQTAGAPLWRMLVSLDNYVYLNLAAAVILAVVVAAFVRRLVFWYSVGGLPEGLEKEDLPPMPALTPLLAATLFFVLAGTDHLLMRMTPFVFSCVPIAISTMLVLTLNTPPEAPPEDSPEDSPEASADAKAVDSRRWVGLRLVLAGAFAAVGAWEGLAGFALAPFVLILAVIPLFRRERTVGATLLAFLAGFVVFAVLEWLFVPTCSVRSILAVRPPTVATLVILAPVALMVAVSRWKGLGPATVGLWTLMIAGAAVFVGKTAPLGRMSASENFVRMVFDSRGERNLIIEDGLLKDFMIALAPSGLEIIGTTSNAEKERLLALADETALDGQDDVRLLSELDGPLMQVIREQCPQGLSGLHLPPRTAIPRLPSFAGISRRAVIGHRFYSRPEFLEVLEEVGVRLSPEQLIRLREASHASAVKEAEDAELRREAERIVKHVNLLENIPESVGDEERGVKIDEARELIREGMRRRRFRGRALASSLLTLDMMRRDVTALEADALDILMFDRDDPAANAVLGNLRFTAGQLDAAERYLKRAVQGGGALAMNDYARLLVEKGRNAEAVNWAKKAVQLKDGECAFRETLIVALIRSRDYDEALKALDSFDALFVVEKPVPGAAELSARLRSLLPKDTEFTPLRD